MRKLAVSTLAGMIVLGTSNFAFAWSGITGTIDKINTKTHEVVLDNGQSYFLEKKVKMTGLKKGEKVTLSWEDQKGKYVVNKVTMEKETVKKS